MSQTKRFLIVMACMVLAMLLVSNLAASAQADKDNIPTPSVSGTPFPQTESPEMVASKVSEGMKNTIQAYFELRYQLLSVSPPSDIRQDVFEEFVSGGEAAKDFLALETAKLAMERNWYELRGLRYAKYEYDLKYTDISFDASAQVVTVSVLDNFKIVRERTIESNPENPSVTWGDLRHEIVLRNEQGQWKIISDTYWDAGWREFRKPGLSTSEILQKIRAKMQGQETTPSPTP